MIAGAGGPVAPPGGDDLPMVGRAGARALFPSPRSVTQGALVGDTVGGSPWYYSRSFM